LSIWSIRFGGESANPRSCDTAGPFRTIVRFSRSRGSPLDVHANELHNHSVRHIESSRERDKGLRATRATRLIMEVLNFSGDDADEDRKLDIVPKYMHLRRDLNTVSISQRLQQRACPAHSDFNGPGVID
jgi:hypothetical protein